MAASTHADPSDGPGSHPVPDRLTLAASLDSARLARAYVRGRLAGQNDPDLVEAALVVVSELVTNAVRHAHPPITVRVVTDPTRLRIDVGDGVGTAPAPRRLEVTAAGGRGLPLIAGLANRWGVTRTPGGKVVWAEFDVG
jgi:anti-sigma regulatory factor (Ser/Thr protein kinase)